MLRRFVPFAVLALLVTAGVAQSTTVIPPTFDQLVSGAQSVFVAEVIAVRAVWRDNPQGRSIKTLVTFRVEEVWKGQASPVTQLEFLGGTIDDVTMKVHGVPSFRPGQRDVLFVENGSIRMVSPLVGFMHGRMRVERDPGTGLDRVRTYDGRSFNSTAEIGAARASSTVFQAPMRLSDLESAVRARASAGRAR